MTRRILPVMRTDLQSKRPEIMSDIEASAGGGNFPEDTNSADLQIAHGRWVGISGGTSMTPVAWIMSPDLNGTGVTTWRTPISLVLPEASVMFRIGSLKLSYTRTCPVKSKRSPVFRAKTKFATSAQLVSTAANIAHKKFIGALCQICGIFSSGKGRAYTHPFGCVLYKEGLYIFYSSYKCWNNMKVVFSNYSDIYDIILVHEKTYRSDRT